MEGRITGQDRVDAAVRVARRHGIDVERPALLRSTNNLVVHLAPAPVVAKVGRWAGEEGESALAHELAVGVHLARLGAPIAEPCPDLPAVVHHVGDLGLTFWRYYPERNPGDIPCERIAAALREFHRCLSSYPGPLPDFRLGRVDARDLFSPGVSPRLRERDRAFLVTEHARTQAALAEATFELQPIHGGPHRYNWLDTGRQALLIDLETVCLGPRELDVAYLGCPEEFPGLDPQLLMLLRDRVSLGVAIACWTGMEAVPQLAWHAAHHLGVLRGRAWGRRQGTR